jgi:branched-chain amino acid transport system ATP-binding protein
MSDVLACAGVVKAYGGVSVLRGIDLRLAEGEICGLVGANGAGKTTLIDIIGGQLRPDSGLVHLGVAELIGSPLSRARRGLARTFQRPQVALDLSLRENVMCGVAVEKLNGPVRIITEGLSGIFTRARDEVTRVEDVCSRLGLVRLDRRADRVSFGELRMVEVARALISNPRVVVLDEPFPGVGEEGIARMVDALRVLKGHGCGVLVVDHNVDVLTSVVDRLALLAEGTIVIHADVDTCMRSPIFRSTYIGVV